MVYRFTRRIKKAAREVKKKESELASVVQESISSARVVKAFAREDFEEERLDQQSQESVDAEPARAQHQGEARRRSSTSSSPSAPAWCSGSASGSCSTDRLTAGALLVFVLYLGKMYKPMKDLSKMADTLSKAAVGFERIGEILAIESQVRDLPGARPAPPFNGRIEFDACAVRLHARPTRPARTSTWSSSPASGRRSSA